MSNEIEFINYEIIMRPFGNKQTTTDMENIRSNMLIAIIRYTNNKCHFIMFDLLSPIISSAQF